MTTVAENIKEARMAKRYTQKELADLLHVKPATISSWEVGRNEPSISMLKKLSSLLNVSFDELAGVVDKDESLEEKPLTKNQKLIAYSIDPDIPDDERQAIIEMVQAAKKLRKRI